MNTIGKLFKVEDGVLAPGARWNEAANLARRAPERWGTSAFSLRDLGRLMGHASLILCDERLLHDVRQKFADVVRPDRLTEAEGDQLIIGVGEASRALELQNLLKDE